MSRRHRVVIEADAWHDLDALAARDRAIVGDAIERRLRYEPTTPTRHCKMLRGTGFARWELRLGKLRVYYDVVLGAEPTIIVKGVAIKEREEPRLAGGERGRKP